MFTATLLNILELWMDIDPSLSSLALTLIQI